MILHVCINMLMAIRTLGLYIYSICTWFIISVSKSDETGLCVYGSEGDRLETRTEYNGLCKYSEGVNMKQIQDTITY